MKITIKQFEAAIESAYTRGVQDSLANMMTPAEMQSRVKVAILEAYTTIQPEEEDYGRD